MRNNSVLLRGCALAAAILFAVPGTTFAQARAPRRRITEAIDETKLTRLQGNTHPLARPEFDRGAAPLSLPMERMLLVLKRSPEQETALDALLEQQQDASSPNYHQWLTPEQFGQKFGPSDQDIQTVTSWLQSHGFQVARVSNGRTVIEFSGTHAQVQQAFHTSIHQYTVNGRDHWANASDPQIPSALAPVVVGINTLHNFRKHAMHHVAGTFMRSKPSGRVEPTGPQFTFTCGSNSTGQPISCYPLAPFDFATIYNVLPLWNATSPTDGTGQTIAIVGRTNINVKDVSDFRSLFGLPANPPHIILDGPDPGIISGDETEADLDVEWSGAVAKGATIDLVVSQSTETSDGVDLSAVYIVDNNTAPVVSESYGQCELNVGTAGNQFENNLWQQAAAQGMTVFVSAGDNGSAGCDFFQGNTPQPAQSGLQVNGLASTPYNVAVGGTDFNDFFNPTNYWNATNNSTTQASAKSYIPETTWDDSCTNPILGNPQIGFSTNPETNCNNFQLQPLVLTIGGSGGASNCTAPTGSNPSNCAGGYPKPTWQTGTGVPSDGKRDLPDVSLFASDGFVGNFYMMCEADFPGSSGTCSTSNFIGVGGTSAASPAFAGILALVNQATGSRQGNANYVLYKLAAQSGASCTSAANPASTCVFYDVPSGSTIAMPCSKGTPNCNVSNSNDLVGVLSGYSATAGYDLTTGLGSVNAANLINKWKTFAFALKPSSTSLTVTPPSGGSLGNLTHGQTVSFTANVGAVAPATGTPTGNLSLIANTGPDGQQGVQGFTLTTGTCSGSPCGTVTGTTNALPGGTYNVVAQYAGDGAFGGSTSTPPVSVTVNPEGSKTFANLVTLDAAGNPTSFSASSAAYGSGYFLLRVDVGDSAASVSASTGASSNCSKGLSNCPTGTITLASSGTPLPSGTLSLNSQGYAEIQSLATGSYAVSASYSGDPSYGPSTAATVNFTIAKAPTSLTAGAVGSPVIQNNSTEISTDVSTTSDGLAPTGTFMFLIDGSPATGQIPVYESGPYDPNVPVSSGIRYAWADAITSMTFGVGGKHTLTAQYSGDANYAASTSPEAVINVLWASTTTLTSSSPSSVQGQSVTFTAQVTGAQGGPPITGTAQFSSIPGGTLCSAATISANGQATCATSSLPVGQALIRVDYSGDVNYASSLAEIFETVNTAFTVAANPTTINILSPGQSGSTTLTFTAQNGFSGSATLASSMCSGLPTESSCSFNPSTVTLAANGTAQTTLTIMTTAPSAVVPATGSRPKIAGWRNKTGAIALACLLCLAAVAFAYRERQRRWGLILVLTAFALVFANAGCGGGGGGGGGGGNGFTNPGTPTGSKVIAVAITINGVTQTVPNLTVNVQ